MLRLGDAEGVFGAHEQGRAHGQVELDVHHRLAFVGQGEAEHVRQGGAVFELEEVGFVGELGGGDAIDAEELVCAGADFEGGLRALDGQEPVFNHAARQDALLRVEKAFCHPRAQRIPMQPGHVLHLLHPRKDEVVHSFDNGRCFLNHDRFRLCGLRGLR